MHPLTFANTRTTHTTHHHNANIPINHATASWACVHGALSSLWWHICCGNGSPSAQKKNLSK